MSLGKLERAEAVATEALERARAGLDHSGMSMAFAILGEVAQLRGRLDEAATYFTESDVHARQTEHLNIRGTALNNRAELARIQGDVALATTLAEEGLLLSQSEGITFVVARHATPPCWAAWPNSRETMLWPKCATGRPSCSTALLAVLTTPPGAWRAWLSRSALKGATSQRPACARQRQHCASWPKHRCHQPSVKPLSRPLPVHKLLWTNRPLEQSGLPDLHSRRMKRLTTPWGNQARQRETESQEEAGPLVS
jgi:hypothetical protein